MKRMVAGMACVALAATGCAGWRAESSTDSSKPAKVAVTGTEYGFDMPAKITGGVVTLTFANDGKKEHEAIVLEVGSAEQEQVVEDVSALVQGQGAPTPDYLDFFGGAADVPAGETRTVDLRLPEGRYALVCALSDNDSLDDPESGPEDAPLHMAVGMYEPFEVVAENEAKMPAVDGTIVADDFSFDVPKLGTGEHKLSLRNDGKEPHFGLIAEFGEGVTEEQARAAFRTLMESEGPPPPGTTHPRDVAFAGPLSAGGEQTFTLELKPDRTYVALCFMSNRSGGPPHAAHGMVEFFTT
jgi:hypothetical protein